MNRILYICLFFIGLQSIEAQEKYIDSLYAVAKVKTEVYSEKGNEKLIIDLYEPVNSENKRPLILFMHGGGFAGGSPKNPQEIKFARIAASKGYSVGLISYRLVRKGKENGFGCDFDADGKIETFQLAAEDFMDAAKFMKNKAEEFNIDPDKIIVGGSSAGAEAVLNAVYNPDLMFEDPATYTDLNFSAVISLAGALVDVRYLDKKNAIPGIFFHGTADNLVPYATAAHHYCEKNKPGYLILDGSKTIVEKLEELNTSYLFYTFKDARHEISGMPFDHLPEVFQFLKNVVFDKTQIQSNIYK
ncbi:alpha/beta hydrolase [Christiangramia sediminis]|uniref:Alpha/beta hydrolase fold domain-containing protein n=1 Tax=Christiangramia sediminis TaxID=2881336 RepID=A0A9X1LLB2_9FLAO|nr:alpha/beta hydrolase [Christiangramia sediminis]MCB7482579.1 alpha/beta hydrolase fold domain-containing protein [Christiangramia sediminis]